jgi:2,3,4,5-tetrahydropyridine-2-carboxylate N-succinyltransferase
MMHGAQPALRPAMLPRHVAGMAMMARMAHPIHAIRSDSPSNRKALNMTQQLQQIIDQAWEDRANFSAASAPAEVREAVSHVIEQLNQGTVRVAQKDSGQWVVNQWIKKAVLLSFRLEDNVPMPAGADMQFYDKVPTKFANYTAEDFARGGFRVVPPAVARRGSFIGRNVVLMPSYVNIGAYVDEGTMVDTWATVGSCAQIGKNVHLSGGVGIGGVLEPM